MALMYTGRRQIDRYRLIEDGEADKKIDRQAIQRQNMDKDREINTYT